MRQNGAHFMKTGAEIYENADVGKPRPAQRAISMLGGFKGQINNLPQWLLGDSMSTR